MGCGSWRVSASKTLGGLKNLLRFTSFEDSLILTVTASFRNEQACGGENGYSHAGPENRSPAALDQRDG